MHTSGRVKPKATINNMSWPTFHGSLTLQIFVKFLHLIFVKFLHLGQIIQKL